MFEKFRFFMRVQNVRIGIKLMNQAEEQESPNLIDKYKKYIAKNAQKAVKLGKDIKGEEELVESMREILRTSSEDTYGRVEESESLVEDKQTIKGLEREVSNEHLITLGSGTEKDRQAQLVMQSLGVLYGRLDKPSQLKLVYFEMGGKEMLLPKAKSVLERYVDNKIDLNQARSELKEVIQQYSKSCEEKGIKPANITHLFEKI